MKSPYDFMEAVCLAIQAGGDTDSTAAMLGAISGAFVGTGVAPCNKVIVR
jgi:ADP-ribosylglycohydrolase